MSASFVATLVEGEAVLRFPYDDRLRLSLRAIPGRRWDPEGRAWRVPLDPDRAQALTALLEAVPFPVEVSPALGRALERRRAKRPPNWLLIDLARPDENWWFSFATDRAPDLVETLLEHPDSYRIPTIERALVPVDQRAAQILRSVARDSRLFLTDDARHALTETARGPAPRREPPAERLAYEVELGRDRRGGNWVLIAAAHAPVARALADASRLLPLDGPAGSVALAATQTNAVAIAELLAKLDLRSVDSYVERWLERTTIWRGTIEVDGPPSGPGVPAARRQRAPADRAARSRDGLSRRREPAADARVVAGDRRAAAAWLDQPRRQAVRGGARGRAARATRGARALIGPRPADVRARARARAEMLDEFARLPGVTAGRPTRREHEHIGLPSISADPFCVPGLDQFIADHEPWVAPDALVRLQEIREEHANAAGLVALSAATDAALEVPVSAAS